MNECLESASTMRGTAWPNGAYRQHHLYEDGIVRPTVETISGVLHVRETIFGHKWVYKLNETRREAKQQFKRHFEFNYFVLFIAVIAVSIIVGASVLFTVFGPKYFQHDSKNNSSQLQATVLNRTKLVFKIHTKSHFPNKPSNKKENTTILNQTTENSILKQDDISSTPGCVNCQNNEICLQNTSTAYPECTRMKDSTDPTGCGGLCQLEIQSCKKLDDHLNIFSCIDIHTLICTKEQWKCESTLMCILTNQTCDGVIHCYDRSDEFNCDCELSHSFRCTDNISCFSNSKKCDGSVDCWDASDEKNCTRECGPLNVPCYNGECIPNEKFCDGIYNCKDKSDEPRGCYNPNVTIGRAYR